MVKRIRNADNGRAMSKYDIAVALGHYRNLPWKVMYDAFTYEEMADFYKKYKASVSLTTAS